MNSRERVLAALNHQVPDRVPVDFGSFPGATSINVRAYQNLLKYFGLDREVRIANILMFTAEVDRDILDRFQIDTISIKPTLSQKEFGIPDEFIDRPWAVKWRRSSDFTYAPAEGPFQKIDRPTVDDLRRFPWPKPSEVEDLKQWREKAKRTRAESDRALVARLPSGIFTLAQFMRGFEGWMTDLLMNREFSDALHEKLTGIWTETAEGVLEAVGDNVDIVMFGDDFGLQNQPIVSPAMFREQMKPWLQKAMNRIKQLTKAKVALHTCGSVFLYLDEFVDIGIDVLNPLQANAKDMDPTMIKGKVGNQLALWGGIDTHEVLPKGSPEDVRREVKTKIEILGKGGGYLCSADHNILIDIPPKNLITMFEAAAEFGQY